MKLNQREQRILKALQEGEHGYYAPYAGRMNPSAYYSVGRLGKCTREMEKLIKNGLVKRAQKSFSSYDISLTEEGKNFQCELEEPYDVWIVTDSTYNIKVEKESGFLKNKTLTLNKGDVMQEKSGYKFFLNREEAYAHAIKNQKGRINAAKGKMKWEEEKLATIEKQAQENDIPTT